MRIPQLICLLFTLALYASPIAAQAQIELDVGPAGESLSTGAEANAPVPTSTREGLPVFGAHLFQGAFKELSFSGFNPEYRVAIGDRIQLMLWGGINQESELTVDPQGNLFIPEIGPVPVSGVRNADLHTVIAERVKAVFSDTVQSYAVLGDAQPVKVFVTGAIERPGLYGGFSSDSILYFLDQAGGIDLDEGSFIEIAVIRGDQTIKTQSLYDFLVDGQLSQLQFADGDRILVRPLQATYTVGGSVRNPYRFEFKGESLPLSTALALAQPSPNATNLSIERATDGRLQAATYTLDAIDGLQVFPGDTITLTSDLKPDSILITIEGEHGGAVHQVHPYGATVADVIEKIIPSARSNVAAVQLFRKSIAERQKQRILESLDNLERNILNARSGSLEEAKIRAEEASLILRFIERARIIEPRGHVILGEDATGATVALEDGDVLYIPSLSNLVAVHGQVVFPTTQVWQKGQSAKDYIGLSGGLTENADKEGILIVQNNGTVRNFKSTYGNYRSYKPLPGEEIIVLPKPDSKNMQFAKDVSTIIYQIAVAARVAVGI